VLHADLKMDLGQHRQKRSRLGSVQNTANNCTSNNNNTNDVGLRVNTDTGNTLRVNGGGSASHISPGPVSATANAFQNFSIRDKQQSEGQLISQPARPNPPLLSTNPTASASFLHHPSLVRNGTPAANFSFQANQNNVSGHPTPPSSFPVANHPHHTQLPLRSNSNDISTQSTQLGPGKDFDLPVVHGSRFLQPFNNVSAGPVSKQIEGDGQNLPLSQHLSRQQPNMFTQPSPVTAPQVH
jgi:hypothetical protein